MDCTTYRPTISSTAPRVRTVTPQQVRAAEGVAPLLEALVLTDSLALVLGGGAAAEVGRLVRSYMATLPQPVEGVWS